MQQTIVLVGGPLDGQEAVVVLDSFDIPPLLRAYQMAEVMDGEVAVLHIDYWRTDRCNEHGYLIYQYTP